MYGGLTLPRVVDAPGPRFTYSAYNTSHINENEI